MLTIERTALAESRRLPGEKNSLLGKSFISFYLIR